MTGRPEPCHPVTGPIAPGRYLLANGDGVVVPARVIAWIARRAHLDQLRIAARGMGDAELDSVLLACRISALTAGKFRPHVATPPEPKSPSKWVGCGGAAAALGVTDRAIRKAAAEGRLQATKTADGAWRIARADVEQFRATRRRR